jgi:hypothetical protein
LKKKKQGREFKLIRLGRVLKGKESRAEKIRANDFKEKEDFRAKLMIVKG